MNDVANSLHVMHGTMEHHQKAKEEAKQELELWQKAFKDNTGRPATKAELKSNLPETYARYKTSSAQIKTIEKAATNEIEGSDEAGSPRRTRDDEAGSPRRTRSDAAGSPRRTRNDAAGSPRRTRNDEVGSPRRTRNDEAASSDRENLDDEATSPLPRNDASPWGRPSRAPADGRPAASLAHPLDGGDADGAGGPGSRSGHRNKQPNEPLRMGDVLYFRSLCDDGGAQAGGLLHAEGFVTGRVGLQPVALHDALPLNFDDCLYRVCPVLTYEQAVALRGASRAMMPDALDAARRGARSEARKNEAALARLEDDELAELDLRFGRSVQLLHVASGRFLTAKRGMAEKQREHMMLKVEPGSRHAAFKLRARFKFRKEGDVVYDADEVRRSVPATVPRSRRSCSHRGVRW